MSPNYPKPDDVPELPVMLPKPGSYDNYWLDGKPGGNGPCLLSSGLYPGKWFASQGKYGSLIFEGDCIKYFDSPEEALKSLRAHMLLVKIVG